MTIRLPERPANAFAVYDVSGNLTGWVNADGTSISGTPTAASFAALPAAADNEDVVILVTNMGTNGIAFISDGTNWLVFQGQASIPIAPSVPVIVANTGITWTVADNGSGKVRATASAAHGLTTANAVGASLYSTTTQNGWTADTFHEITLVDPAGTPLYVDLDTDYSSQTVPIFALAGAEIPLYTLAIPYISSNGGLQITSKWSFTKTANDKKTIIKYGGTEFFNSNQNDVGDDIVRPSVGIRNINSTSAQESEFTKGSAIGFGSSGAADVSGTINSAVTQDLVFAVDIATADEMMKLNFAKVEYNS